MTYRYRWVPGLFFVVGFAGGCSSASSGTPMGAVVAGDDGGTDASQAAPPVQDAAPAAMCDAVSLAPLADASAAACFQCLSTQCMMEVATCSTDCECAPAYGCLEMNSAAGSINSGYSLCQEAINTLMNGNAALTDVTNCGNAMCHAECQGGGSDGG
jgi:hypothetical protein